MSAQSPPNPKVRLKLIPAPRLGSVVSAPPVLIVSNHSVDYSCGNCDTILMHADDGQIHNLVIRCTKCGSYNTTNS